MHMSSSSEEDEPPPRSRIPQDRLQRILATPTGARLKEIGRIHGVPRRSERSPRDPVALHSRIDAVGRMSQALQRSHGVPSARFSLQRALAANPQSSVDGLMAGQAALAPATVEAAAVLHAGAATPAPEDELVAACGLNIAAHMQTLIEDGSPPEGCGAELGVRARSGAPDVWLMYG